MASRFLLRLGAVLFLCKSEVVLLGEKAKLTKKQQRFCDEYLVDLNICKAGERAGCSQRTAFRIMDNPAARQYIDEKMAEMSAARIADATEVMEYLTSVMRGEAKDVMSVPCDGGIEMVEVAPDVKSRLKAAELLGKRHRLFTDKVEVEAAVPVVICGGDELGG